MRGDSREVICMAKQQILALFLKSNQSQRRKTGAATQENSHLTQWNGTKKEILGGIVLQFLVEPTAVHKGVRRSTKIYIQGRFQFLCRPHVLIFKKIFTFLKGHHSFENHKKPNMYAKLGGKFNFFKLTLDVVSFVFLIKKIMSGHLFR